MDQTDEKLAAVRRGVPVTERIAFLNAGSHGPITVAAAQAIATAAQEELQAGRLGSFQFQQTAQLRAATRAQFARVFACDASEVALTTSTTTGMNIASWGVNWRPDDEIITTTVEHMGGLSALYMLEHRFGVRLRFAETGTAGEKLLDSIASSLTSHTRAVVVSHVSWSSGLVLPLQAIADLAHGQGALLIVDGAQSAGAIPIDVKQLGVDAYAMPGQKWLCGPEGLGALYVTKARFDEILPSHVGGSAFASSDLAGHYTLREEGVRYETPGHPYAPAVAGMKASLHWLLDDVGAGWAFARILENARRCRRLLETIEGVDILTPPGDHAGLVHFSVAGWDQGAVEQELLKRDVLVRSMARPPCLRVSTGFYNNDDDLQALAEGIKEILRLPPHPPAEETG